jgi:O-antigen/teichoic acid export membrane protein
MGIVIRQSIKSVAITLGGVILGVVVSALSIRFFPQSQLGFRESLIKISTWATYIGIFGFNFTLLILGQKYPPGHKARGTFLTLTSVIPFIFCLLVCISFYFFEPLIYKIYKQPDAEVMHQYFFLFPLLTMLSALNAWMEGYLLALHKTALQNLAREILARVVYIALIILFGFHVISFHQFIWWYVILYLVPFLYLLFIAMRNPGFTFGYKKDIFSGEEIKEIFRFSGYHMLTVASTVLLVQIDAFLLGPLDSLEAVGIYSIATLAISMMRNPTRVIGAAATPAFSKSYNNGAFDELKDLFARSAINMQIIGIGLFVLVYLNINNINEILTFLKGGYGQVKLLILILMIGQLFDMITGLNFELIGVTKYYKFNFWIAIMLFGIVFILNFFLIKWIGMYGAAWATSIGMVVFNIAKTYFLWKKMDMQPFTKASFYIFGAAAIAGLLTWIIPNLGNVLLDGTVRSGVFCALLWLFLYKMKVSEELNGITHNIIHKRKLY